jgi:hypothetical protein
MRRLLPMPIATCAEISAFVRSFTPLELTSVVAAPPDDIAQDISTPLGGDALMNVRRGS